MKGSCSFAVGGQVTNATKPSSGGFRLGNMISVLAVKSGAVELTLSITITESVTDSEGKA